MQIGLEGSADQPARLHKLSYTGTGFRQYNTVQDVSLHGNPTC